MAHRRDLVLPKNATNEGSRRLRVLLLRRTFAAIARSLSCTSNAVRNWAAEVVKPSRLLRLKLQEKHGIPADAWDEPPESDDYEDDGEPATSPAPKRK